MNKMNCPVIEAKIRDGFSEWTRILPLDIDECLVRLPFWDGGGDPVDLTVRLQAGRATIDDGGSIAGLLFSLDQDTQGTPAFKLVEDLGRTHGLEVDFNEGVVRLSVTEDDLYEGIAEMAKVVLALHTVVPHVRTTPRRVASFGPRLRSKIARRYRDLNILNMVQRSYRLDGATVSAWPVDFRWSVGSNGHSYAVNVVTADLGVAEPIAKAHKIVALSVDTHTRNSSNSDQLRVVFESQYDNALADEASKFLRFHSDELHYDVFDLSERTESSKFFDMSVEEITRNVDEPWHRLMAAHT